jgi:hypothetical protein
VEGGEMRQIETFVKDERSLDSAISEEEGVGQLRQRVAVFCHIRGLSMFSERSNRLTRHKISDREPEKA